MQQIFIRIVN